MKAKKPSLYDAQELQIQKQTAGFLELLTVYLGVFHHSFTG